MRTITVQEITDAVAALCIRANKVLPCSLEQKFLHVLHRSNPPWAGQYLTI